MSRSSVLLALGAVVVLTLASAAAMAGGVAPGRALVLGPLPLPPETASRGPLAPKVKPVPEFDPLVVRPAAGRTVELGPGAAVLRWTEVPFGAGGFEPKADGVYWVAGSFDLDRWAKVAIGATAGTAAGMVWVDGTKRGAGTVKVPLWRGRHTVMVRAVTGTGDGAVVHVTADAGGEAGLVWSPGGPAPLSDLGETRALRSIGPLAVADGGALIARRIGWMEPGAGKRTHRLDILNAGGTIVAASVGGPSASPIAFLPGSGAARLLLRRREGAGSTVEVFDLDGRRSTAVVRGEAGLAFVRLSPNGRLLLLASARGIEKKKRDAKAPRRRRALREKLPDYVVRRQLFLVDLDSGARRLLVPAGDWTLDDARFDAGQRGVVYLRTVPVEARPWFTTEIRRIDLESGKDEVLATFQGGWEGRPTTVAAGERGRIAFIGPPEEVGPGHAEHNVYNRRVWLLDREHGTFHRIMGATAPAATLGRSELLQWDGNGQELLVGLTVGSRTRLGRLRPGGNGETWRLDIVPASAEVIGSVALSEDRGTAVWVGSSRNEPAALWSASLPGGTNRIVERPNAAVAAHWKLARATDWSFTGPGGQTIDAWWYAPLVHVDSGKVPLIVYYYGGATPTLRRFSGTHQVFAGNGYAVLVLNPRGALGYGDAFADEHVDDWGPRASADILAGVAAFVTSHPRVDPARVGIYGGSYGGFMTEYLISHSDRFAAAVAMYGISDIAAYWGAGTWGYTYGDTALAGSFPWNAQKLFAGHSPLDAADRIRTPLLLLHGLADINVPEGESEELYTALETLGRRVELVTFPGEDHGIAGSWKNWIGHRRMMLEFFDRILRHQPGAWNERWGLTGQAAD